MHKKIYLATVCNVDKGDSIRCSFNLIQKTKITWQTFCALM